ncbi:MAG: glycine betaine ABC transporter substrate-binding protein [Chloroflexota bacterium]
MCTKWHWWTKYLRLFMALFLIATLVSGCTSAKKEKPVITFYEGGWESQWLEIAIAQFIIEKGYDYPTESIMMSNEILFAAVEKGEVDVDIEEWPQNVPEWYNRMIDEGYYEEMGYILEGGPQFFCIPKWVAEQYNIKTVYDMKDHWELFKDPEDSSKGLFINSLISWGCTNINEIKLEAYGLSEYYNIITPGSSGAWVAAMAGPQKKNQPVFGYYYSPTPLMGMYDWYILEEPEHDPALWDKINAALDDPSLRPVDDACNYPDQPLPLCVHTNLREKAPDVVDMFDNMTIGLDRCSQTLAWVEENEVKNWEVGAVYFLREFDSHWKTWVPNDVYQKIKKAVDDYGSIP